MYSLTYSPTHSLTYRPQYCEGDFILHFAGMRPHWGCSDSRTLVMQYCSGAAKDESAVCAPVLFPPPLKHTLASPRQPPATCTEPQPEAPEHVDPHRQEPRDRSPILTSQSTPIRCSSCSMPCSPAPSLPTHASVTSTRPSGWRPPPPPTRTTSTPSSSRSRRVVGPKSITIRVEYVGRWHAYRVVSRAYLHMSHVHGHV